MEQRIEEIITFLEKELIKKHGLSSFREDPVENRELQKNSNINFTEQYGAVKHKSRFLGDPKHKVVLIQRERKPIIPEDK